MPSLGSACRGLNPDGLLKRDRYDDMAIADGGAASREYLRVTFGAATAIEKQKVRRQLEEYCALDTMGMIIIVDELMRM